MDFHKRFSISPVSAYVTTFHLKKHSPSELQWRNRHHFRRTVKAKVLEH